MESFANGNHFLGLIVNLSQEFRPLRDFRLNFISLQNLAPSPSTVAFTLRLWFSSKWWKTDPEISNATDFGFEQVRSGKLICVCLAPKQRGMKITIWVAPSPKQCSPDLALSKTVSLPFFPDLLRKRLKSRHRNRESGRAPEIEARKLSISLPISPLHDSAHFPEARHTGWASDLHTLSVFVSKRSEMKLWWGRKEFSTKKSVFATSLKIHPAFFSKLHRSYTHMTQASMQLSSHALSSRAHARSPSSNSGLNFRSRKKSGAWEKKEDGRWKERTQNGRENDKGKWGGKYHMEGERLNSKVAEHWVLSS